MFKKRTLIGLLLFLILLISGCTSHTQEIFIPKVEADVYIYDADNLLDESVEEEINNMLIDLEKKTSSEFAVITVESLLGKQVEDYSIKVANGLGIGKEDKDNGVLLLMSRSDKRVRLEIGKGLEGILNDAKCGRILDEYFVPYREKDEYTEATKLTVQAVINVIATDANVTVDGVDESITVPEPKPIPWGKVIGIIIILIIVFLIINWLTDGAAGEFLIVILDAFFSSDGDSDGGGFGGGSFGGGGASR